MRLSFQFARAVFACLLLAGYGAFWITWTTHQYSHGHNHAAERQYCIDTTAGDFHFHDEDYAVDDCSLCQFLPATPEIATVEITLPATSALFYRGTVGFAGFFDGIALRALYLRGPPVVAA
jgi:hypothetical protein